MSATNRRFPPPWTVEDIGAAFVVKDRTGQRLATSISRKPPGKAISRLRKHLAMKKAMLSNGHRPSCSN
jgi:hypothetical protein